MRNISIRSRFFLLFIITIILWLLSGFIINSYFKQFERNNFISLKLSNLSNEILILRNAFTGFQEYDLENNDFFNTGNSQRLNQVRQSFVSVINQIRELNSIDIIRKNPVSTLKINSIADYSGSLENLINTLVSRSRERGYGEYGLQGYVMNQLNPIEAALATLNNPRLSDRFKSLKESANIYFLNSTVVNARKLDDLLIETEKTMNDAIPASFIAGNGFDKQKIISLFTISAVIFRNIINIDREIGISEYEGLNGEIQNLFDIIQEETHSLITLYDVERVHLDKKISSAILLVVLFSLLLTLACIIYLARSVSHPLNQLSSYIRILTSGKLPDPPAISGNHEITKISGMLGSFAQNLKEKASLAAEISKEKHISSIPLLSDEDMLGKALTDIGKFIETVKSEDIRLQAENEKRRWSNEGLAKFEEILRISSSQLDTLADNIVQNLVKYLNASLGTLFLTGIDNEDELSMAAAFAFDRKKYIDKKYKIGEGMVGTCAIEKQKIFITDIPEDYVRISSGLGDTRPRSLLLIPLKLKDEILGVLELASMNIFEDHEIEFVEKIAESIASTIASVRMNMRTAQLLEQSQKQAREMAEQEEKLRQQMEELQSTQEESARRESEISGILKAIHQSSLVAEYDMDENLISINDKFLILLETHSDHIIGKKYHEILGISRHVETYKEFWKQLREGKTTSNVEKIKLLTGNEIWLRQTYTPIFDKDGMPFKVLNIATDITETIRQQESIEKQSNEIARANMEMQSFSDAVDKAMIKCIYSSAGLILEVNNNFEEASGFSKKELIGKNNRIFLQKSEREQFDKIWIDVMKDKTYSGVIRRTKPTGEEIWIMSTLTPVKDENGTIFKVIFLGQDITERKLKYQLLEEANKEIERLRKLHAGE